MTQTEAIQEVEKILGKSSKDALECTGDASTCPVDECYVCGVRDCPGSEPLHFHHDGCPYCEFVENDKDYRAR